MLPISAIILTKDNERTIRALLSSLQNFDEVILADSGSTDRTLSIAEHYPNVKILTHSLSNFGVRRNELALGAQNPWILAIDSDEELSPSLQNELINLQLNEKCLYAFPFKNFYRGKWIKGCGWYPDYHLRLYHREKSAFSPLKVHEKLTTEGLKVVKLKGAIHHFSYFEAGDFLRKMERYSELFAEEYQGKKRSSFFKALAHGFYAFLKSYFLKRGFRDGKEGYLISLYNGQTAFYKYIKLAEKNQCL